MTTMACKSLQIQRYLKCINQQLGVLREERDTIREACDECVNQVQNQVDAWLNGGLVNQTSFEEVSKRVQHAITFLITKSVEISDLHNNEIDNEMNQTTVPVRYSSPGSRYSDATQAGVTGGAANILEGVNMKLAILEEALNSLKMSTKQVQEKQEKYEMLSNDLAAQKENLNKKFEILRNANLKSKKEIKERLTDLEKTNIEFSNNVCQMYETVTKVDELSKTVTSIDVTLNRLEEDNKALKDTTKEVQEKTENAKKMLKDVLTQQENFNKNVEILTNANLKSKKRNQERFKLLTKTSEDVSSKVDDLFKSVANFNGKLNKLEEENKSVNVSMNDFNKQISSVKDNSKDALMAIQDLSKSIERKKSTL